MQNNIFISSAIITTIFEKDTMDNIDLVKPFVLYIISHEYEKGDEIDLELIHDKMDELFSFKEMPVAVIKKIIKRLIKEVNIYIKDGKYILMDNIDEYSKEFDDKKNEASRNISEVSEHFKDELISRGLVNVDDDLSVVEEYLNEFLEMNGFSFIKNISDLTELPALSDELHFSICDIITNDFNEKNQYFEMFYKLVEGFMLVNVVYLQIKNNNKESLKKLDIFFDAPLILNALGLKTNSSNLSTKQLLELLKKQNASLYCFREHYAEVENILVAYKYNIGKYSGNRTLEKFDEEGFTESDVELYLSTLENKILSLGIKIVDRPTIKKEDFIYYISESEIIENIKKIYSNELASVCAIETDVAAANAINYFRRGVHNNSLENSNAIFVTDNNTLIYQVNHGIGIVDYLDTKLFMSEIDLTTIVWQKSYNENRDFLRTSLISNVQSGFEPPKKMLEKVSESIKRMSSSIGDEDNIDISRLLSSYTQKREFMYKTKGNYENVTDELVDELITSRAEELSTKNELEKTELKNENADLANKNKRILKELNSTKAENKRRRDKEVEYIKVSSEDYAWKHCIRYKILIYILYIVLIGVVLACSVYLVKMSNNNKLVETIIQFFGVLGIIILLTTVRNKLLSKVESKMKKKRNKRYHELMLELDEKS